MEEKKGLDLPWRGNSIFGKDIEVRPTGRGTVVAIGRRDVILSAETALAMAAALVASAS